MSTTRELLQKYYAPAIPKYTKTNPSASNKSHARLIRIGRRKWLKINGGISVLKGFPPYIYEYRADLKPRTHGKRGQVKRKPVKPKRKKVRKAASGRSAALKAWRTRRKQQRKAKRKRKGQRRRR